MRRRPRASIKVEGRVEDSVYRYKDLRLKRYALVISILGFSGLGWTVISNTKQIRIQNLAKMTDWILALNRLSLEHPELIPYFEDGLPIDPSDRNYQNAVTVVETWMDTLDSMLDLYNGIDNLPNTGWREWIYDVFTESPLLCAHLERRREWYNLLWVAYEGWLSRGGPKLRETHQWGPARKLPR